MFSITFKAKFIIHFNGKKEDDVFIAINIIVFAISLSSVINNTVFVTD